MIKKEKMNEKEEIKYLKQTILKLVQNQNSIMGILAKQQEVLETYGPIIYKLIIEFGLNFNDPPKNDDYTVN